LRILLVEDDTRFAQWLQGCLSDHWPHAEITTLADLPRALAVAQESDAWALAIVDMNLGEDSGVDLIDALARRWPQLPVLVLTAVDEPSRALSAIRAGAQGYILKTSLRDELVRIVQQILDGGSPITPSVAHLVLSEFRQLTAPSAAPSQALLPDDLTEKLTSRETEVLRLLARGYSDKEVGADLCISPLTVDSHVRKIYRKLSINSRVQLRRLLG
jgi:DNA-binding NarL/FixJ family response regulator